MPFGFGSGDQFDPAVLGEALTQFGQMLSQSSTSSGPVNWTLAHDTARSTIAAAGDPVIGEALTRAVAIATTTAQLWLDEATSLPATAGSAVWSRSEWLEATLPAWHPIVEPVAASVQAATDGLMNQGATDGGGDPAAMLPPELAAIAGPMLGQLSGFARQLGATMFGAQIGRGLAELSTDVLSACDVGIPLHDNGAVTILGTNVTEFAEGLGVDVEAVRLYVVLREAAHQRLFANVGWLRSRLLEAVEAYARGITVDRSAIESAMRDVDPSDMGSLSEVLAGGVLAPEDSDAQRAALLRLETLLALVEGWVDDVVATATEGRLPQAEALREAMRRRRATGGPAERVFANLVGLEMRPRRLREAADMWRRVREVRGAEGRDALWGHPDLLPVGADLDDAESVELFLTGDTLDLSDLPPEGESSPS